MLREIDIRGISRYLLDDGIEDKDLHLHISEVGPGERKHPPHRHGGVEAFYILEGEGTLELDDERFTLRSGEAAVIDPRRLHGLVNNSGEQLRYIVVLRS